MNKEINVELTELVTILTQQITALECAKHHMVVMAAHTGKTLLGICELLGVEKGTGGAGGGRSPGLKGFITEYVPQLNYDEALKYMRIAQQYPEILTNSSAYITNLPISSIIQLLGSTEEVKDFIYSELRTGNIPSTNTIIKLNKESKALNGVYNKVTPKPYVKQTNTYSGVYEIRCIVNGIPYIGQAQNLDKRRQDHFSILRSGTHTNKALQNDFNRFGEENFFFNILELCSHEMLAIKEHYYIKLAANRGGHIDVK